MKSPRSFVSMQHRDAWGKIVIFPILLLVSVSVLFAAEFWEKKTYYEWTDKECAKMLTDSPWAWELKLLRTGSLGSSDAAEGQQYVSYIIQLRSATPVRQAMVRRMQLVNKYDSLSTEQKQAFDKSAESFLNADYGDKVVLSVSYSTNIQRMVIDLSRAWQSQTMELLKNSVFLYAGKGDKARLLDFNVAQGAQQEFQFVFPREVNGKPILTDKDKSLTLEFAYPVVGGIGDGRGYVEFKTKKMLLNGNLEY